MNEKEPELLDVKCCYGHLGGMLGDRLFDRMLELGWFRRNENMPKSFSLTELGIEKFKKLGVDLYKRGK